MRRVIVLALVLFGANIIPVSAAMLRMARNGSPAEQIVSEILVTEILARAGHTASVSDIPPIRSHTLIMAGAMDGEIARFDEYFTQFPTLIKIAPSHYHLNISVFAKRGVKFGGRDDLRGHSIAALRATYYHSEYTDDMPNVWLVNSPREMFAMLNEGRVDMVIDTEIDGMVAIKQMQLTDIVPIGVLMKSDVHMALAPTFATLVPDISKAIVELTTSGQFHRMIQQAETELLAGQ